MAHPNAGRQNRQMVSIYKATLPSLTFLSQALIIAFPSSFPSARANGTATAFPICLNCYG